MTVGLGHYLLLSSALFAIGLYGALAKRNAVVVLMCIELMLNAVNISLVAFSRFTVGAGLSGQMFAIFVMTVAAAEVAVGLALIISIYRARGTVDVGRINLLKW